MSKSISRRNFVSTASAAAAAPAFLSAQTAGSKIAIGWVGLGNRGGKHIHTMVSEAKGDAYIKAICDTFTPRMGLTKDKLISDGAPAPETYDDYYKMIEDSSLDAIVVMTPEHLHRDMVIAALEAGKHVYCEKPLTHTIEEGFEILQAIERSGKKFQVGTQRRSAKIYHEGERDLRIRRAGRRGLRTRLLVPQSVRATAFPAWRYNIPGGRDAGATLTSTRRFWAMRRRPKWNKNALLPVAAVLGLFGRHLHRPAGPPDRRAAYDHRAHLLQERRCATGGVHAWEDGREVPDVVTAGFRVSRSNFHLNYSVSLRQRPLRLR